MTRSTEPAPIAVLDIGKTNLKLLVASDDGWPLETLSIPNTANASDPYLSHDLAGLETWFLDALAKVSQRHAIGAVIGVSILAGMSTEFLGSAKNFCAILLLGNALYGGQATGLF